MPSCRKPLAQPFLFGKGVLSYAFPATSFGASDLSLEARLALHMARIFRMRI